MREITAYQSADGKLHTNEKAAIDADENLLGEELDGLLRLFKLDIGRHTEYRGILAAMKNRAELLAACRSIVRILEHGEHSE